MAKAPRDRTRASPQRFVFVVTTTLFVMILMHLGGVRAESSVTIKNLAGADLKLQCWSTDDLGTHILHDQQQIYWGFHASVIGDTKFSCCFWLTDNEGRNLYQRVTVWIDGWVVTPTVKCGQCLWNVDETGFSVWNKDTQSFYHAYYWLPAAADTPSSNSLAAVVN